MAKETRRIVLLSGSQDGGWRVGIRKKVRRLREEQG